MDHKTKRQTASESSLSSAVFIFGLLNSPTARAGDYEEILQLIYEEILQLPQIPAFFSQNICLYRLNVVILHVRLKKDLNGYH